MTRRVCLISLLPLSAAGGGERHSLCVAASAAAAGDECVVFSPEEQPPSQMPLPRRLATRFIETAPNQPHRKMRVLDFRAVLDHLARPDVVLLHQFLSSDLAFDVIANVSSDQTLLFTTLGLEPLRPIFEAIYQASPNHYFIEISRFAAGRSSMFSEQTLAVSGGFWRKDLRDAPSARQRPNYVGAVGRVLPHKGFEITLDALPRAAQLFLVGPMNLDPEYGALLRQRAVGRTIHFLGRLDDEARNQVISECRTVVASSCTTLHTGVKLAQAELLGLVIFEALAQFCLPITSDLPPFAEAMENLGLGGWIYPQRNSGALAQLLNEVQKWETPEFVQWVAQARARMIDQYDWDTYWPRLIASLSELGVDL